MSTSPLLHHGQEHHQPPRALNAGDHARMIEELAALDDPVGKPDAA